MEPPLTDLEDRRFHPGVLQEIHEQGTAHIRNTEVANQSGINELFQGLPCLTEWNGIMLDFALPVEEPSRRIALFRGDVREGYG